MQQNVEYCRKICVCTDVTSFQCDVSSMWRHSNVILRVWVSGNFSFHYRSQLCRQSDMYNSAAICAPSTTRRWFLLSHQVWEFGRAGPIYFLQLPFSKPTAMDHLSRCDVAMWQRRHVLRWGRRASLILLFVVVFLFPTLTPVQNFLSTADIQFGRWLVDGRLMVGWWQVDDRLMRGWWEVDERLVIGWREVDVGNLN
jgi:hypothetical protein